MDEQERSALLLSPLAMYHVNVLTIDSPHIYTYHIIGILVGCCGCMVILDIETVLAFSTELSLPNGVYLIDSRES